MINISVVGLGYVGSAMSIILADTKNKRKNIFNVTGLDLDSKIGLERINRINTSKFPFKTSDVQIEKKLNRIKKIGNLKAKVFNLESIKNSSIILVSINFDFSKDKIKIKKNFKNYKNTFKQIVQTVKENTLIVIESTLPPGFINNILLPVFNYELEKRNVDKKLVHLAYSYERVTPGKNYIDSISNGWRVYSAINEVSKTKCRKFLEKIINTKDYPLTELENITAAEAAKTLENSYRAINIALIEEWTIFAETIGINLNKIIDAIKLRPTHNNMMFPGLGVGGYCLTKDPLLPSTSADFIFKNKKLKFNFSELAIKTNNLMPNRSFNIIKLKLQNKFRNKKILLCGAAYKDEVDDTRNSPSLILYKKLRKNKAKIDVHDPLVEYWIEAKTQVINKLPNFINYDVIIFATKHLFYKSISLRKTFSKQIFFDLNKVLSEKQIQDAHKKNTQLFIIGKGFV
jgi:UDP-N-acetyl-D-glucosamine dehydrogenase